MKKEKTDNSSSNHLLCNWCRFYILGLSVFYFYFILEQ